MKQKIRKIKIILHSWWLVITNQKCDLADLKMEVCNNCPLKTNLMGVDVCGSCHCPLISKTRAKGEHCPMGKW